MTHECVYVGVIENITPINIQGVTISVVMGNGRGVHKEVVSDTVYLSRVTLS